MTLMTPRHGAKQTVVGVFCEERVRHFNEHFIKTVYRKFVILLFAKLVRATDPSLI